VGDVRGRVRDLCVRRKGDILDNIVEESQKLESVGRNLTIMKQRLEQFQIFQQLLLADSSKYFSAELSVTAITRFSDEKCVKVTVKNLSDYNLLGKYWSLKLDSFSVKEKSTQSKTTPLPTSFSRHATMSCLLPISSTASDLPISVRSHLVFSDEILLPSLPLLTNQVTVLDVLTMSGVGVGSKKVLTDKEKFIRSLVIPRSENGEGDQDHKITFTVERNLYTGKKSKVEEVLSASENNSTHWTCLDKSVNIYTKFEDDKSYVQVTLVGYDYPLLSDLKKEIEMGIV